MTERRSFPNEPSSIRMARRFVAETLDGLAEPVVEAVMLSVSELATNAVRHANSGFTLEIEVNESRVRVRVADGGDGRPTLRAPEPMDPFGRGLQIVELLSDAWGVTAPQQGPGKSVWFDVRIGQ